MQSTTTTNRLLAALNERDCANLAPLLEPVRLPLGEHLEAPHRPFAHVYFVDTGMVSVVAVSGRKERAEVGLIGNEGVTGLSMLFGVSSSRNAVMVQAEGTGRRIGVAELRESICKSTTLREHLLGYAYSFFTQASQTALANGTGQLEERLARWLLMAHDRLQGDDLALTQFLSTMLAVRRAGVTVATHFLEAKGLIKARPGLITVRDREGLIEAAHGHYGAPEKEYARVMGELNGHGAETATLALAG